VSALPGSAGGLGLNDTLLTAAVTQTQTSGRSTLDYLEEHSGLGPVELTGALAEAFDYRMLTRDDLARLEPAEYCRLTGSHRRPLGDNHVLFSPAVNRRGSQIGAARPKHARKKGIDRYRGSDHRTGCRRGLNFNCWRLSVAHIKLYV